MKLPLRPNHCLSGFCIFGLLLTIVTTTAACESHSDLEHLYCQLKYDYKSLPSMEDFRRNSAEIQRLLLKRPAADAGLTLPPQKIKRNTVSNSSSSLVDDVDTSNTNHNIVSRKLNTTTPITQDLPAEDCKLSNRHIRCDTREFHLIENQSNSSLQVGSLDDSNQLIFSDSGGMTKTRYWSASYRLYIEKMLSIGLGASTMSYTKFVYTWRQAQQQGQNAQERFKTMFEFLKRDKRALAVRSSYDSLLPAEISWCQSLSRRLWVCDNRQRNWVYALR